MATLTATEMQRLRDAMRAEILGPSMYPSHTHAVVSGNNTYPATVAGAILPVPSLVELIQMRMRNDRMAFEYIQAHESKDSVFVFIVHNGVALTLTDEKNLFPSDTLVTQLRMMRD